MDLFPLGQASLPLYDSAQIFLFCWIFPVSIVALIFFEWIVRRFFSQKIAHPRLVVWAVPFSLSILFNIIVFIVVPEGAVLFSVSLSLFIIVYTLFCGGFSALFFYFSRKSVYHVLIYLFIVIIMWIIAYPKAMFDYDVSVGTDLPLKVCDCVGVTRKHTYSLPIPVPGTCYGVVFNCREDLLDMCYFNEDRSTCDPFQIKKLDLSGFIY